MPARSCRVTITDLEGIAHTVEVTATTLYEAIALGLVALRGNNWVMGIPDGFAPVRVRVTDVPVEHEVKMKDFKQWIERRGNTPKDVMDRKKDSGNIGNRKVCLTLHDAVERSTKLQLCLAKSVIVKVQRRFLDMAKLSAKKKAKRWIDTIREAGTLLIAFAPLDMAIQSKPGGFDFFYLFNPIFFMVVGMAAVKFAIEMEEDDEEPSSSQAPALLG